MSVEYRESYSLMCPLSRDMNFAESYLALITITGIVKFFSVGRNRCLPGTLIFLRRVERSTCTEEKCQPLGYLSSESTSPSQDAFIADTDSHFSAVEIFEEWNCIFA